MIVVGGSVVSGTWHQRQLSWTAAVAVVVTVAVAVVVAVAVAVVVEVAVVAAVVVILSNS